MENKQTPIHYSVHTVDSKTNETIKFYVYGRLRIITINKKKVSCIVNEYDVPLYIETINTIDIKNY